MCLTSCMPRTILHVDMDAFYAAVEQRDHPDYRGKPVIVGADPKEGRGRGIVATCSYEARRFGVRSAQPISEAWRRCPHAVYVRPDMETYEGVSSRVMAILSGFTDLLEQVSIDEAFLDVTGSRRLYGSGREIAGKIKLHVIKELGLTASVGVAANKFVAKVASDLEKPDGLVVVEPGGERDFLAPLPISRLWGVGPKTERALKNMGLERVGQLASLSRGAALSLPGENGLHLWMLAQGIDDRQVSPGTICKSIGHEITFEKDTADFELVRTALLSLAEKVAYRLRENDARARTVVVKYREADFSTFTRQATLNEPVDTSERIFPVALKLVEKLFRKNARVRLIGITGSGLEPGSGAARRSLFSTNSAKDRRLAGAIDDIVHRFGGRAVTRAALITKKSRN
ncbi:MAG TPA: DNA polymerase IV [Acidobacteriota bacterium]|nr:DNA polymerase IV [Acidobacteriota bacterium]